MNTPEQQQQHDLHLALTVREARRFCTSMQLLHKGIYPQVVTRTKGDYVMVYPGGEVFPIRAGSYIDIAQYCERVSLTIEQSCWYIESLAELEMIYRNV